jgi:OOP family OmpA-OmpF porin
VSLPTTDRVCDGVLPSSSRSARSRHFLAGLFFSLAASLLAVPGAVAADHWELGFQGGFVAVDKDLSGPDRRVLQPTLGLRASYQLGTRWGLFGDGLYSSLVTNTFRRDARVATLRGGFDLYFTPDRDPRWFIDVALGYMDIAFENAEDFYSGFVSAGFGQHVWLSGRKSIRWELRADHTLAQDGLSGEDVTQAQFLIGLTWGPHRRHDSDRDGFTDRRDRCPSTPAGLPVDEYGCSIRSADTAVAPRAETPPALLDSDNDGVIDGNDRCTDTVVGIEVDEHGCPVDHDGDGVHDGLGMDKCPDTPDGATVDEHGCPRDSDDDGILDGLDRCPGIAGATTDGCPEP